MTISTIALIGFGEVGQALAAELSANPHLTLKAFDVKMVDKRSVSAKAAAEGHVVRCRSAAEAATGADLIISAVTAAQTETAAQSVVAGLKPGAWFMDLNSASPEAKIAAAHIIEGATGRYIEASVMSPIEPKRLGSPILLGGPHAEMFSSLITALGFTGATYYSDIPGKTAATKLCRSVMIKGLEALISESLLSARHYGVEDTVLSSLNNLFPHPDWEGYARYMISRTLEHGARRSEEMREAAKTVAEAGLTPWMSTATADRQAWAPDYAAALKADGLIPMLDAIRAQLGRAQSKNEETSK
jgi:3-hydroxyisobutyrate dehydrogenase-like beta-hydroxyacid dehydrogenase